MSPFVCRRIIVIDSRKLCFEQSDKKGSRAVHYWSSEQVHVKTLVEVADSRVTGAPGHKHQSRLSVNQCFLHWVREARQHFAYFQKKQKMDLPFVFAGLNTLQFILVLQYLCGFIQRGFNRYFKKFVEILFRILYYFPSAVYIACKYLLFNFDWYI